MDGETPALSMKVRIFVLRILDQRARRFAVDVEESKFFIRIEVAVDRDLRERERRPEASVGVNQSRNPSLARRPS